MVVATNRMEWTDDLSVGHKKLDGQHKGLIRLINRFGNAVLNREELAELVNAVIAYAARHFTDEENYIMRKAPALLDKQIKQHAEFIEVAYDFADRFNQGSGDRLRQEIYIFLCDWLLHHIREEDRQYKQPPKAKK